MTNQLLREAFAAIFCLFFIGNIIGQESAVNLDEPLMETKWRYTYALHVESNTIIHQAENFYDFYLFFRYTHNYEQYLNGKFSSGGWNIDGTTLNYSFKNIKDFEIAELNKTKLILEFTQSNAKGTYQYHFVRIETKEAPFQRAWNELPEVNVEADAPKEKLDKKRRWVFGKKKNKSRKKSSDSASEEPYINIELIGGGYYGGVDPVLRDFIHIKSNGRLVKEFKSIQNGLIVTKKDLARSELVKFIDWVKKEGYFELDRMYDCQSAICQKRKRQKPTPIPLRLAITYGNHRKVITISIWGMDEHKVRYVDYPPVLDDIIGEIQKMAHRPQDPSLVGK